LSTSKDILAGSQLDDGAFASSLDPADILGLTVGFADQCREAIRLGNAVPLASLEGTYANVLLAGMGGSAAAGDYLQALFDLHASVPFQVSRDYTIPAWVNRETLVVCSSYSGNTEETLAAYQKACNQGAKVLVVTSGGKIAEEAEKNGHPVLKIPGGQPPRTALGYTFFGPLCALVRLKLLNLKVDESICSFLDRCIGSWGPLVDVGNNEAKQIAAAIHKSTPVFYGLGAWQGAVAKRWKAQINENAKRMSFAHSFPELNHNEILGWLGISDAAAWSCVVLSDLDAPPKMLARCRLTLEALPAGTFTQTVPARGTSLLEKILFLSLLGDFVSVYMSFLLKVDPGDISLLERFKVDLAQVR
jgi:glucose/mannose-6-phosphate isomerase